MTKWHEAWICFRSDEEGATAAEYTVMAALVVGVIIVTVSVLGLQIEKAFNDFVTLYVSVTNG